jgi:hypothetical protein
MMCISLIPVAVSFFELVVGWVTILGLIDPPSSRIAPMATGGRSVFSVHCVKFTFIVCRSHHGPLKMTSKQMVRL